MSQLHLWFCSVWLSNHWCFTILHSFVETSISI